MRSSISRIAQLAGVAALTLAVVACSSPKKPMPITQAAPPPLSVAPTQDPTPRGPPPPPQRAQAPSVAPQSGPMPGSLQDFVAAAGGDRVFFDYDSSSVRNDAQSVLDAQAGWLARYPQVKIRIEGNADERGTREYNFALGAQRANSVKEYLVRKGVSAGRIETVSYGKERPIDAGDNETAWSRNRNGHTALTGGAT